MDPATNQRPTERRTIPRSRTFDAETVLCDPTRRSQRIGASVIDPSLPLPATNSTGGSRRMIAGPSTPFNALPSSLDVTARRGEQAFMVRPRIGSVRRSHGATIPMRSAQRPVLGGGTGIQIRSLGGFRCLSHVFFIIVGGGTFSAEIPAGTSHDGISMNDEQFTKYCDNSPSSTRVGECNAVRIPMRLSAAPSDLEYERQNLD